MTGDERADARKKRYGVGLDELEASARVPLDEQVSEADISPVPAEDVVPPDSVERMRLG
jgi:hypothetical protein